MKHIVSRGHTRPLTEIGFVEDGPNNTLLFSSAHDKTPQIRDGETGDWKGSFHGHKGAVWSMKIDPASRTLAATASGDFTAKLWCAYTGKDLFEFKHKHVVKTIDFSLDTLNIATGCQDGTMRVFDTCAPEKAPLAFKITSTPNDGITKLSWSTTEKPILLVSRKASLIEKWDIRQDPTAGAVASLSVQPGHSVMDFHASYPHNTLLAGCNNHIHVYSLSEFRELLKIEVPSSSPNTFHNEGGVALSPDGQTLSGGGADLWLREFSVSSGELLRTFKGHHGPVRCVAYPPGGRTVASGSEDGTIRLWDLTFQG